MKTKISALGDTSTLDPVCLDFIEQAQISFAVSDAQENAFVYVSSVFAKERGFMSNELIGKSILTVFPADKRKQIEKNILFADLAKHILFESEHQCKNGRRFPVEVKITTIKSAEGKPVNRIAHVTIITERNKSEAEIFILKFYDPLTNLPNRRLFIDRLHHALVSCRNKNLERAILLIDLDNFKLINETLGYAMGDLLLQQVVGRLLSCIQNGDSVARLSGDEFVVLVENPSTKNNEAWEGISAIGRNILAMLSQPYKVAFSEYRCSASIGISMFNRHDQNAEDLLKQADIAMSQAKKAGRNTLCFWVSVIGG